MKTAVKSLHLNFVPDRKGMVWDLLLYIPVIVFLMITALKLWYGGNQTLGGLLSFLAFLFFFMGFDRILKTRLFILPRAAKGIELHKNSVAMLLRNGERVNLVKNLRYFPDYMGNSFGLTGMDAAGRQQKFVLHKGLFANIADYQRLVGDLSKFK